MRRSPTAFLIGLLALGTVAFPGLLRGDGPAAPGATASPPTGAPVTVETEAGDKIDGTFVAPTVRLRTEIGTLDLDVTKLDQMMLEPAADGSGTVTAAVVAHDHTTFTGTLLADSFGVTVGEKTDDYPAKTVRVITFRHPKDRSAVAIAVGLITLTLMEIVLGVDNIIFLAIVAGRLPPAEQPKARRIGLIAALGTRIGLLLTLSWILGLTKPVFTLPDLPFFHTADARGVSWRDLILLLGGLFLVAKSVLEIHKKVESVPHGPGAAAQKPTSSFASVIVQIAIIDLIFSLDSVVTAVGMVDDVWVMVVAMMIAVGIMMVSAEPISRFVDAHPTLKVLALSFLILIGVLLVAEGLGQHLNKGYIYFAMAFGVGVEMVNMRFRGPHAAPPAA
ncbi:MAG: TerC family protein [Fimbriiglobus sp.]